MREIEKSRNCKNTCLKLSERPTPEAPAKTPHVSVLCTYRREPVQNGEDSNKDPRPANNPPTGRDISNERRTLGNGVNITEPAAWQQWRRVQGNGKPNPKCAASTRGHERPQILGPSRVIYIHLVTRRRRSYEYPAMTSLMPRNFLPCHGEEETSNEE